MKKIICVLMGLIICLSMVVATEEMASGDDNNGNPYFYDRGKPYTVLNDNVCSSSPDYTSQKIVNGDLWCWDNKNGGSPSSAGKLHNGVVMQVFSTYNGKVDKIVADLSIDPNEKGCAPVTRGKEYYMQVFYCDQEQVKCKEIVPYYTVGCDYNFCGSGKVLRQRVLYDVTSNGCNGWTDKACISDAGTGYNCDGGSNVPTPTPPVTPPTPSPVTTLSGEWQNLGFITFAEPNTNLKILGRYEAKVAGTYYLEAGILKTQGYTLVPVGSLCDGSKQFSGQYFTLKAGEKVDLEFNVITPETAGDYTLIFGAYTGCIKDGGSKISVASGDISIDTKENESSQSFFEKYKKQIMIGLIIAGIVFILIIAGLLIYYWVK